MLQAPTEANDATDTGKGKSKASSASSGLNGDSMPDPKRQKIEDPRKATAPNPEADLAARLADSLKSHGIMPGMPPPPLGMPPPPLGMPGLGPMLVPPGQPPPPPGPMPGRGLLEGASSDEGDIAARLASTLKSHMMPPPLLPPLPPPPAPPGGDLGSQLLASLQALTNQGQAGNLGFSQEGQMLSSVVQQSMAISRAQQLERFIGAEGAIRLPPDNYGGVLPDKPLDKSLSSGDGTVHRLPPGFGAIPQDIIDARLREKEDERLRQRLAGQPCRYGRLCKRRDCPQAHPEGREIDSALNLCSFGRRCKRKNCFYDHPEGREIDFDPSKGYCKSGINCSRADCLYEHPEGRILPDGPEARVCYFCHQAGHISQDCPSNPGSWCFNPATLPKKEDSKVAIEDGKSETKDGKSETKDAKSEAKDEPAPAVSKSASTAAPSAAPMTTVPKSPGPLTPGPLPVGKMS